MTVVFLFKYKESKKKLQPWVAAFALALGTAYSGPVITFIKLLATGTNVTPLQLFYIAYWNLPIQVISMIWLGFSVFAENKRKTVIIIVSLTAVIYYAYFFIFPEQSFTTVKSVEEYNAAGELLDISFTGIPRYLLIAWMASIVITFMVGFSRLLSKIKDDKKYSRRVKMQLIGWVFYVIGGGIEVMAPVSVAIVGRIASMICFIFLFFSFS